MKSTSSTSDQSKPASALANVIREKPNSGLLTAHYELFKKVGKLDGSIVNCGCLSIEHFTGLVVLNHTLEIENAKKQIVFEKHHKNLFYDHTQLPNGGLFYKTEKIPFDNGLVKTQLIECGIKADIEFVAGYVSDAIPQYLIENPELKIAFLSINLNDYDGTMTALQFFFPRLVKGGVVVFDNYCMNGDDFNAVKDYFTFENVEIQHFSLKKGPYFIVV